MQKLIAKELARCEVEPSVIFQTEMEGAGTRKVVVVTQKKRKTYTSILRW